MDLQHRIYLGPRRPDREVMEVHADWYTRHAGFVLGMPHLRGYVQNRPHPEAWDRLPFHVCVETWFDDRAFERASFSSAYYRDIIVPDEERFIVRETAWNARVARTEVLLDGPRRGVRLLSFGGSATEVADADGVVRVERLHLTASTPDAGEPVVVSAFVDRLAEPYDLVPGLGGMAFAATAVPIISPPAGTW